MRHAVQAAIALVLLLGLPVVLETPSSTEGMIAAAVGALVLMGLVGHGLLGFLKAREKQKHVFHDSIMPSKHVDLERTSLNQKAYKPDDKP